MASGRVPFITGCVTGTGAALEVKHEKVGFQPKVVKVYTVEDASAGENTLYWNAEFDGGTGFQLLDPSASASGGDTDVALVGSDGITPLATGFSIGALANLNVAGELLRFEAWG